MAKRRKRTNSIVPAKGRLREMADKLWSLAVRMDGNYHCAVCGSELCEAHHLIPRQHYATRYELCNGICLCARCHQFDADISPHQNAGGWMLWLENNAPLRYQWLMMILGSGEYRNLGETKNSEYFCRVITQLRPWVEGRDYESIVGVRFGAWLENTSKGKE